MAAARSVSAPGSFNEAEARAPRMALLCLMSAIVLRLQ